MYLLVIWNVADSPPKFRVCLIECIADFTWDEDKLWALYREYDSQFDEVCDSNMITWLMYGGVVIRTRFGITYGSDYKLDIIISEGTGKYKMKRPIKIDPKRLVSSLSMLIILMYAVRLFIRPSFKLNIHNRCLNVDLISPIYVIHGWLDRYGSLNHKVYAGDTMRSGFINRLYNATSGALIYKLQRKQLYESTEISADTSNATHLLVVWRTEFKKLYADTLLVEYDNEFDKDNLEELYRKNVNQFRLLPDFTTETWPLDDNVALMTAFEITNEDLILNITISEVERHKYVRKLAHIDPER
jgi:hypothetical protein